MLIADADRTRAVEELGRHCAAGRIALDDYAGRLAEVLGAADLADLDHALRDLPMVRIAEPSVDPPVFAPGRHRRGSRPLRPRPRPRRSRPVLWVASSASVGVAGVLVADGRWLSTSVLGLGWVIGFAHGRLRPPPGAVR